MPDSTIGYVFDKIDVGFNEKDEDVVKIRKCYSCGIIVEKCFCSKCLKLIKNFDDLRNYVNDLEVIDIGVYYLITEAYNLRLGLIGSVNNDIHEILLYGNINDRQLSRVSSYIKNLAIEARGLRDSLVLVKKMLEGDKYGSI